MDDIQLAKRCFFEQCDKKATHLVGWRQFHHFLTDRFEVWPVCKRHYRKAHRTKRLTPRRMAIMLWDYTVLNPGRRFITYDGEEIRE